MPMMKSSRLNFIGLVGRMHMCGFSKAEGAEGAEGRHVNAEMLGHDAGLGGRVDNK